MGIKRTSIGREIPGIASSNSAILVAVWVFAGVSVLSDEDRPPEPPDELARLRTAGRALGALTLGSVIATAIAISHILRRQNDVDRAEQIVLVVWAGICFTGMFLAIQLRVRFLFRREMRKQGDFRPGNRTKPITPLPFRFRSGAACLALICLISAALAGRTDLTRLVAVLTVAVLVTGVYVARVRRFLSKEN